MTGVYNELRQRGFIYQCTDEEVVSALLDGSGVTFYTGYDPTAESLHVGSLIPIFAMTHLQRAGHTAIAVLGEGTAMVGDPSGKTEMRKLLLQNQIRSNGQGLKSQLTKLLGQIPERFVIVNNADWLSKLHYIDFLREIGRHFSVNKMLSAESYRIRLETGLSFLEFNYMLLQAYDFLVLHRDHGCLLQLGGQDQWGNIVAGTDLIRRKSGQQAFGLTLPLLTDSAGNKIGKSVSGAVWLSPELTSPFDFYQFWRNVDDADVGRFLGLFTFLPVEECWRLGALDPPLLNRSKEILGYEVTRLVHGEAIARQTYGFALGQYPSADPDGAVATSSSIVQVPAISPPAAPGLRLSRSEIAQGIRVVDLLVRSALCQSNGEARRLIRQGGVRIGTDSVQDETRIVGPDCLTDGTILRVGKKRLVRLQITD